MSAPDLIPLAAAVLCQECSRVSASTGERCVGCGSKAIANVERLLAGTPIDMEKAPLEDLAARVVAIKRRAADGDEIDRVEMAIWRRVLSLSASEVPALARFHHVEAGEVEIQADANHPGWIVITPRPAGGTRPEETEETPA